MSLTKDQEKLFESLINDEIVDEKEIVDNKSLKKDLEEIEEKNELEIWNITGGTAGSSAPVLSGAGDPGCPQDGINPCASCDCC